MTACSADAPGICNTRFNAVLTHTPSAFRVEVGVVNPET